MKHTTNTLYKVTKRDLEMNKKIKHYHEVQLSVNETSVTSNTVKTLNSLDHINAEKRTNFISSPCLQSWTVI